MNQTTTTMKAKFFYAPAIFSPTPKIFVLTSDNVLYSETRTISLVHVEALTATSFTQFDPKMYETEEYPILIEIGLKEASDISTNTQSGWVGRYLQDKNVFLEKALQA